MAYRLHSYSCGVAMWLTCAPYDLPTQCFISSSFMEQEEEEKEEEEKQVVVAMGYDALSFNTSSQRAKVGKLL